MRFVSLMVVMVATLAIGGCCGAGAKREGSASKTNSGDSQAAAAAAASLPWLATVDANCAKYKEAPNQIKKSDVFRDNEALLNKTTLQDVRGKLTSIETDQGGSEVQLTVQVGDVTLKTPPLTGKISRGTPVYAAAGEMKEGQCVIFSADQLKASSLVEQSKVCDHDYFVRFTALKPCP